jgi:hypothetical protein
MRIKKRNFARLASISALGAGALGVSAAPAEAGIVYTPLGADVGPGHLAIATVALPGGSQFKIQRYTHSFRGSSSTTSHVWFVNLRQPGANVKFRSISNSVSIVGLGKKWGSAAGKSVGAVAFAERGRQVDSRTDSFIGHNGAFTDKYALFKFRDAGQTDYGWLELSNAVSLGASRSGPDVTLIGYAYDTTGAQLAAGDEGSTGTTPEPSGMAMTGLAALALGATGLRRWRAARKSAA